MSRRRGTDDLRSWYDPDDDDLVREAAERTRRRSGGTEPPGLTPPAPLRDDEVVCRRCHLVVRRTVPAGATQLLCDDCRW